MLGDTLNDRYVLSGLLGAGGMAEVFLARDRMLDRDVALKVLRDHYAKDGLFVRRFRKEAQSAAALNHPNVVKVYDLGCAEDGRYFIAMEYVPGGNLKEHIFGRGHLDPAEAARLAWQVAEALGAAHELGIVHRDIKPQNVLLDEADNAKVADFGIALAASRTSTSGTDLLFGTASYMSPEQAMGERVGPESDLYSLGVVLYEMLTGSVPFAAEGPLATAMKHVTEQPVSPKERDPSVPETMDALVMRLLAKNPEDRYASAAELAEDLLRAWAGLPLALAARTDEYPETPREPASADGGAHSGEPGGEPRTRKGPIGIGLVALATLLALLGALGWTLSPESGGSKAVGAVSTSEGSREGGFLGAPEDSRGAQEEGLEKGVGSDMPSAVLASGTHMSASSSTPTLASASASASASPESGTGSVPAAPEPPAAVPSDSLQAPEGSYGSGGQGAGTMNPGAAESAAQEQYR